MRVDLFDYELPAESIATHPPAERDGARMLVVSPDADVDEDRKIVDLPSIIAPGSLVVLNDTRVFPARLVGRKEATGGRTELLLLESAGGEPCSANATVERWRAIGRASKGLKPGAQILFGDSGQLVAKITSAPDLEGVMEVVLYTGDGSSVTDAIDRRGTVPLPPYLGRAPEAADAERYQTVFARARGSAAAPTAGLHLTPALLAGLSRADIRVATLTLHVGLGTFRPVSAPDFDEHDMHEERMEITESLATAVRDARARGAPVVAIGTTVARALESAAESPREASESNPLGRGLVSPMRGKTKILIQPGQEFRVVDALLTNFHLPRSTLLAMVAAFAGRVRVLAAYREAIRRGYRFYSYGDAMFLRRAPIAESVAERSTAT